MSIIYVYTYLRYSSHNQDDGNSIKAQRDGINDFIKNYPDKIKVVAEYSDKAISGMSDDRPGYKKMIDNIKNDDKVTCIIVHRLDRLHRNARNQLNDIFELQGLGKKILTADGIDTSNPGDMPRVLDEASGAEKYALHLKDETRKGLMANAVECKHNGGKPPYGYIVNASGLLEIDPKTAPAVKKMFEMKSAGMSYNEIIAWLNQKKYKTVNGNQFSKETIISILRNEKYKGIFTWDKSSAKDFRRKRNTHRIKDEYTKIEGGCPKIVSDELFEKVQKAFTIQKQKSKYKYLVNGKVFCAECGKKFKIQTSYTKSGESVPKYLADCKCHSPKTINQRYLDDMVAYALGECLFSSVNIGEMKEKLEKHAVSVCDATDCEIKTFEKEKASLEKKRNNLIIAVSNGYGSKSIAENINKLDQDIVELNEKIAVLLSANIVFTEEEIKSINSGFVRYITENYNEDTINTVNDTIERVDVGLKDISVTFSNGIRVSSNTKKNFN